MLVEPSSRCGACGFKAQQAAALLQIRAPLLPTEPPSDQLHPRRLSQGGLEAQGPLREQHRIHLPLLPFLESGLKPPFQQRLLAPFKFLARGDGGLQHQHPLRAGALQRNGRQRQSPARVGSEQQRRRDQGPAPAGRAQPAAPEAPAHQHLHSRHQASAPKRRQPRQGAIAGQRRGPNPQPKQGALGQQHLRQPPRGAEDQGTAGPPRLQTTGQHQPFRHQQPARSSTQPKQQPTQRQAQRQGYADPIKRMQAQQPAVADQHRQRAPQRPWGQGHWSRWSWNRRKRPERHQRQP